MSFVGRLSFLRGSIIGGSIVSLSDCHWVDKSISIRGFHPLSTVSLTEDESRLMRITVFLP